jgi:hypothetical protein
MFCQIFHFSEYTALFHSPFPGPGRKARSRMTFPSAHTRSLANDDTWPTRMRRRVSLANGPSTTSALASSGCPGPYRYALTGSGGHAGTGQASDPSTQSAR